MRKDKLYFLTFLSATIIFLLVAVIASRYFIKDTSIELIASQIESGHKETKTFTNLVEYQLQRDLPKDTVVSQIQDAILNTNQYQGFISIIDWSGRIICHPDIKKVGQNIESEKSYVSSVADNLTAREFYLLLQQEDQENPAGHSSGIIFMHPVNNSDWIATFQINIKSLNNQIGRLQNRFYTIFAILGLIIIPLFVISTRYLASIYEKRLELQKQKLEDEVLSLTKLNRAVGDYKQKVIQQPNSPATKKRILTHLKHELLSVPIEDIAHIYTENTITYIVCFDGSKSTTNSSLDELFSQLDETSFFRANRQFIIAITSINKIVKYGNNQLKIVVNPEANVDILISKNKASEFKSWLDL